jgi:hypothetical protein
MEVLTIPKTELMFTHLTHFFILPITNIKEKLKYTD